MLVVLRHTAFSRVNCEGHPLAQSMKTCCIFLGRKCKLCKSLPNGSTFSICPFWSSCNVLVLLSVLSHSRVTVWLDYRQLGKSVVSLPRSGALWLFAEAPSYLRGWRLRLMLSWSEHRRKQKETLGSWRKMFHQKTKSWITLHFLSLHTVNVDELSCIIFELFPYRETRSKGIQDEIVPVCLVELQRRWVGLCLVNYNLSHVYIALAIILVISNYEYLNFLQSPLYTTM